MQVECAGLLLVNNVGCIYCAQGSVCYPRSLQPSFSFLSSVCYVLTFAGEVLAIRPSDRPCIPTMAVEGTLFGVWRLDSG